MRFFERDGLAADWRRDERLVVLHADAYPIYSTEGGRELIAGIEEILAAEGAPLRILASAARASGVPLAYALLWVDFLGKHPSEEVRLVVYDLPSALDPLLRVLQGTTRRIEVARDEAHARRLVGAAWALLT